MRVGVYINPGGCSIAGGVEVSRQVVVVLGIGGFSRGHWYGCVDWW